MKPYKRIFTEMEEEPFWKQAYGEINKVKKIVDISNLEWTEHLGGMSIDDAIRLAKQMSSQELFGGWRLPTIEELYSAFIKKYPGFDNSRSSAYWSGTPFQTTFPREKGQYFVFSFTRQTITHDETWKKYFVRLVREV